MFIYHKICLTTRVETLVCKVSPWSWVQTPPRVLLFTLVTQWSEWGSYEQYAIFLKNCESNVFLQLLSSDLSVFMKESRVVLYAYA
jgi:hypothetical protein